MWLRAPVAGVLGEGGAGPDDDRPRPALQRFDLRKREVKELAAGWTGSASAATAPGS